MRWHACTECGWHTRRPGGPGLGHLLMNYGRCHDELRCTTFDAPPHDIRHAGPLEERVGCLRCGGLVVCRPGTGWCEGCYQKWLQRQAEVAESGEPSDQTAA